MIKVLFFAQVRELVGTDSLTLDASELATVEAVRQQLAARGDRWALALEEGKLLAAVNQTLTAFDHPVASGDEVAFFPPVPGADMTQTRIVVSPARFSVGEYPGWPNAMKTARWSPSPVKCAITTSATA
jgi:molybdopterin synthase sulfur carrier subunit